MAGHFKTNTSYFPISYPRFYNKCWFSAFACSLQPIYENPEDYVVRVRSFGIANLHSDWSVAVPIRKALQSAATSVDSLSCTTVARGSDNLAALEISWNPIELPAGVRLIHYLVGIFLLYLSTE